MLISTQNEIVSLMPTARWSRPEQLLGYLEEEERVSLEPLLGTALYQHILDEYERLRDEYEDITSTTIKPTRIAKEDARVPYADVTERLDAIQEDRVACRCGCMPVDSFVVPSEDMAAIRLIRICQQIEFYKMLSHKAGLLTVSFNEGGGMNVASTESYEPADDKRMDRVVKDAYMSAGRSIDSLLLFLEADAKGERQFTELWKDADTYFLHKDLLFQTARVLNEYLDINGERMAYNALVRDIRFCQNTYIRPRIGNTLLKAILDYANGQDRAVFGALDVEELISLLRTALAFYVESRRTELPSKERLARRDSISDAQQAMSDACQWIEQHLEQLGDVAVGTPVYESVQKRKEQAERDAKATERHRLSACEQGQRKLFTAFPATHQLPETRPA